MHEDDSDWTGITRVFFTHFVNQIFDGDLDPLPCLVLANGTRGFINVRDGDGGN